MKIAFVFNDLSNRGTNIATRDFICQLKKSHDLEIDVYFFDKVDDELDIKERKTHISFFSRVDFSKYDIVHSSTLRSDFYVFINRYISFNGKQTKYVTSVHSMIEEDLAFNYGKLISKLVAPIWLRIKRNNDAIIVSSDFMYKFYHDLFKNKNSVIIEYGRSIDPIDDFVVPEADDNIILKLKNNFKIIGSVGSLIKRKNYTVIIELLKRYDNYAWVCLGIGEEFENLKNLLKENQLENRVAFLGFRRDSRPYYDYFDVFCHPSRSEGFGLVNVDAMSHKKPMLLAELEVYKSKIKNDMAFYFKLDDQESLYNAFEKINKGGVSVEKAVEKSFEIYESNFSIEVYGLKHYNVFCDLLLL